MKNILTVLILLFLFSFCVAASDAPDVSAESAVVMLVRTGEVIYAKNEHEQRGIASTTKIMTALLTLECGTPNKTITVTEAMTAVEGTSMGLLPGDKVNYRDLVYGMLLASGNDAANAAAISISGSVDDFAKLMNNKAEKIGMKNTNFVTPSGLDAETHYSTAYDMALLGCYAIQNPSFLSACSSQQAELCYGNEPYKRYLYNHNRLLNSFEGAVGIKTGFTKKSGRCLVGAAERYGVMLVCVTLNASDDWNDHKKLLNYGFDAVSSKSVREPSYTVDVFGGSESFVSTLPVEAAVTTLCDAQQISTKTYLEPYLIAPVMKGEKVGRVVVYVAGKKTEEIPVLAACDITATTQENKSKLTISDKIKIYFNSLSWKIKQFFKER